MHGISSDELFAQETRAISQNGQRLAPDGAALRKEKLAVTKIGGTISKIRYGIQ
jgi:hypothetical protein